MNDNLTNDNFLMYAAKMYDNPGHFGSEEFIEDLRRFKYIKKLITRYLETGDLKERLILNHIIVLNNVFGPETLCRMIWLKLTNEQLKCIKPFLVLLNILPPVITKVNNKVYYTDEISMDNVIVEVLRKI
jgi:hypothetical protein